MKAIILFLSLLLVFPALSQDFDPPKSGATLHLDQNQHKIAIGQSITADVWLVRSKASKKTSFEGLKANTAPGLLVKLEPHNQDPDRYVMNISVASEVDPGKYAILVKGQGKNAHKIKGTTFSLVVTEQLNATN